LIKEKKEGMMTDDNVDGNGGGDFYPSSDRLQPQTFYPIISQIVFVLHYFMSRKMT
jgi:hypothetical protein